MDTIILKIGNVSISPCHKTVGESFNCLFCYCPLYALGDQCGGNFTYIEGVRSAVRTV